MWSNQLWSAVNSSRCIHTHSLGYSVCWFIKNARGRMKKTEYILVINKYGGKNQPPTTIDHATNIRLAYRIINVGGSIINHSFRLYIPYN